MFEDAVLFLSFYKTKAGKNPYNHRLLDICEKQMIS
jgi:hypothetical protein